VNVFQHVCVGIEGENKCMKPQFAFGFHILNQSWPMIKHETLMDLFIFLKLNNNPIKHWNDYFGWEMAMTLSEIVECRT
jgi:hypothetical protein